MKNESKKTKAGMILMVVAVALTMSSTAWAEESKAPAKPKKTDSMTYGLKGSTSQGGQGLSLALDYEHVHDHGGAAVRAEGGVVFRDGRSRFSGRLGGATFAGPLTWGSINLVHTDNRYTQVGASPLFGLGFGYAGRDKKGNLTMVSVEPRVTVGYDNVRHEKFEAVGAQLMLKKELANTVTLELLGQIAAVGGVSEQDEGPNVHGDKDGLFYLVEAGLKKRVGQNGFVGASASISNLTYKSAQPSEDSRPNLALTASAGYAF